MKIKRIKVTLQVFIPFFCSEFLTEWAFESDKEERGEGKEGGSFEGLATVAITRSRSRFSEEN